MTKFQKKLYREFQREIKEIVKDLMACQPERIILFGSWARGDFNEGSDIDILVIKKTRARFLDRTESVLAMTRSSMDLEILVYTPEEFQNMQDRGNPFALEVLETGKIMYEK